MARKTDTKTLLKAMRILARDIQSDDGVANGAISEAADRMEELQAERDRLRDLLNCAVEWVGDRGYDDPETAPEWFLSALQEDRDD